MAVCGICSALPTGTCAPRESPWNAGGARRETAGCAAITPLKLFCGNARIYKQVFTQASSHRLGVVLE